MALMTLIGTVAMVSSLAAMCVFAVQWARGKSRFALPTLISAFLVCASMALAASPYVQVISKLSADGGSDHGDQPEVGSK